MKFSTKASSEIPRKAFPEHLGGNSQFNNYIIWCDTLWLGFNGDAADRVEKWFLDKQNSLSKLGFLLKVSEVSNRIPGYRLAIKIDSQVLPVRPTEFSTIMLKECALRTLELSIELDKRNLVLTHLEPGQFGLNQKGAPIFTGLSAISEKNDIKFPFSDFASLFLCKLWLVARDRRLASLVRRLNMIRLEEYQLLSDNILTKFKILKTLYTRVNTSPFGGLFYTNQFYNLVWYSYKEWSNRRRHGRPLDAGWTISLLLRLKKQVSNLDVSGVSEKWSGYHSQRDIDLICSNKNFERFCNGEHEKQIIKELKKIERGTMLDLGANQGFYSLIGARLGFDVTSLDTDSGAIDKLYFMLMRSQFVHSIKPAVIDFTKINDDANDRFKSDVVLALGFTHHMRLDQGLSWCEISEKLAKLTKSDLITEFKINTKASSAQGTVDRYVSQDYKLNKFTQALKKFFKVVEVGEVTRKKASTGERQLIICSGKVS